jgi:hypothetical protein
MMPRKARHCLKNGHVFKERFNGGQGGLFCDHCGRYIPAFLAARTGIKPYKKGSKAPVYLSNEHERIILCCQKHYL